MASQIVRIIAVCGPLLFGDAVLDSRHVVLCSFGLDVMVFIAFMIRNSRRRGRLEKDYCAVYRLRDYFVGDKAIVISSIVSSAVAILLPWLIDIIGGGYEYKTEGAFLSLLSIHLVAFIAVYYGNDLKELLHFYKNKLLLIESAVILAITVLCFAVTPVGALLGIDGIMGPLYFVAALVPAVVYVTVFLILDIKKTAKRF